MNWKKWAAAAVVAVLALGILELWGALLSPHVVYVGFALAAGGLGYKLAPWEIDRIVDTAKGVVKQDTHD